MRRQKAASGARGLLRARLVSDHRRDGLKDGQKEEVRTKKEYSTEPHETGSNQKNMSVFRANLHVVDSGLVALYRVHKDQPINGSVVLWLNICSVCRKVS